jgi:hypothetical protein
VAFACRLKETDIAPRVVRPLIAATPLVVAMLMVSACSINGMGFASSEVIEAQGARVVRTETYGVALRSSADDAGVTIGYSWTLALIPDCAAAPPAGKYSFGVSMAGIRPIASVRRTGGLALDLNRHTIGYSWTLALIPDCAAAPPAGKYSFGVSMAGIRPIASVRRTGGLALDLNRHTIGVMLGFSEDAIFSEIPRNDSIVRRLVLAPDEPSQSEFHQTPEHGACG